MIDTQGDCVAFIVEVFYFIFDDLVFNWFASPTTTNVELCNLFAGREPPHYHYYYNRYKSINVYKQIHSSACQPTKRIN